MSLVFQSLVFQSIVLALIVALVGSQGLLLSPILPDIAASFEVSIPTAAYAMAAYSGAIAVSAFFLARFIDVVGPAWMARGALVVIALGLIITSSATNFTLLMIGQIFNGLACGILLPCAYTLGALIAPKGHEALYTGRVLSGWGIAMVLGVPFSAFIADQLHWRQAFVILAIVALLALIMVWMSVSTTLGERRPRPAPVSFVALSWPRVTRLLIICFAFMASFYGVYAFLGAHVRETLNLEAGGAALFVFAYGLGFGLASFADGFIDRLGAGRVLAPTFAGLFVIYALLPLTLEQLWIGLVFTFVWGYINHFGINLIISQLVAAKPDRRGEVLGFYSTATYVASMVGTGVLNLVYGEYGFAPLSWIAAGLMALSVAVWIIRPNKGMLASR